MSLIGVQKNPRRKFLLWVFKKLLRMDRRTKDFWRRALFFFQMTEAQKQSSKRKLKKFTGKLRHLQKFSPEWKEHKNIKKHYLSAFFDYKPLPLDVPVLYLALRFSGHAWRRITKDTVYINLSRANHTSLSENYSQYMVDKIRDFINR